MILCSRLRVIRRRLIGVDQAHQVPSRAHYECDAGAGPGAKLTERKGKEGAVAKAEREKIRLNYNNRQLPRF